MTYSITINYSSHLVSILDIIVHAIDYNYRNKLIRPSYALPWDQVNAMKIRITFSDYMPPFVGRVEKDVLCVMPEMVKKLMLTNKNIIHEELSKFNNDTIKRVCFYTESQHQFIRALKQLPILITSKQLNPKITITPQTLDYYNKNFINMVKHMV